jgi:hypothetical protein
MAQNPDEHTQRERTGLALKIGGLLTLAGIVIILGPHRQRQVSNALS